MKTIGIIDDKDSQRRAFMLKIGLKLGEKYPEWKTCDIKPFFKKTDYRSWILEQEISVLIIDERLNEGKLTDGSNVGYYGSELVKELRESFKDIPIFCITNYEITSELKKSENYFNLTLSRKKFDDDIDNYLNLFIKSGTSFYKEFQRELARLGELSAKIAIGDYSQRDIKEVQSLQTTLVLPHLTEDLLSRESYLDEIEKKIRQIKSIQENLTKYLEKE